MTRGNSDKGAAEPLSASTKDVREIAAERGIFLAVEGQGAPSGRPFNEAVERLRAVTYRLRTHLKKAGRGSFKGPKVELQVLGEAGAEPGKEVRWRLLARVPDDVTNADVKEARQAAPDGRETGAPRVGRVCWREGRALQILQVGNGARTAPSYATLRAEADRLGYRVRGGSHEIYLSDPRRAAPHRLRRIVRLPIAWPRPDYARGKPGRSVMH